MSHCTSGRLQLFKKNFLYSTEYKTWLRIRLGWFLNTYNLVTNTVVVGKENKGKRVGQGVSGKGRFWPPVQ